MSQSSQSWFLLNDNLFLFICFFKFWLKACKLFFFFFFFFLSKQAFREEGLLFSYKLYAHIISIYFIVLFQVIVADILILMDLCVWLSLSSLKRYWSYKEGKISGSRRSVNKKLKNIFFLLWRERGKKYLQQLGCSQECTLPCTFFI